MTSTARVRFPQLISWDQFDEIVREIADLDLDILWAVHQPVGGQSFCIVEWDIAADLMPTNFVSSLRDWTE